MCADVGDFVCVCVFAYVFVCARVCACVCAWLICRFYLRKS